MKAGLVGLLCVALVPSVYAADMGMKDQSMEKPMMESAQKMNDGMMHQDKMMGDMKDGMKSDMKSEKKEDMQHSSEMGHKDKKPMM